MLTGGLMCIPQDCLDAAIRIPPIQAEEIKMTDILTKQTDRLQWFQQARFGMFIHWGVYALQRSGEWVMNADSISVKDYRALAQDFRAENFDADAWAAAAKRAGMKYLVFTTKHHDGFCMWNTKTTAFNAAKIGPRRDVVRAAGKD